MINNTLDSLNYLWHVTEDVKVSMLTHAYPRKPLWEIMVKTVITGLTAHFTCDLMFNLVICKHSKRVWSYMTLNVFTQTGGAFHWVSLKNFSFRDVYNKRPC